MNQFRFEALNIHGEEVTGFVEANDDVEACCKIKNRGYFLTRLEIPDSCLPVVVDNRSTADTLGEFTAVAIRCRQCGKTIAATTEMRFVTCSGCLKRIDVPIEFGSSAKG